MFFLWISFFLWASPVNFQQDVQPKLVEKISRYSARREQIEDLSKGKRRIEQTIPSLIQVSLLQQEALEIQKSKLMQDLKIIEQQRIAFSIPAQVDSKTKSRWSDLQQQAWDSKERALQAELKVLLKIEIFNEQYSDFEDVKAYLKNLNEQLYFIDSAQLEDTTQLETSQSSKKTEILEEIERINSFIWELHHQALGGGTINSILRSELDIDLSQRSSLQIETTLVILNTIQKFLISSEIIQKLSDIEKVVLTREIQFIKEKIDEEKIVLLLENLSDDEIKKTIEKNEQALKELSDKKNVLQEEPQTNNPLKLELIQVETEFLQKKNSIFKEDLHLDLFKVEQELQEARSNISSEDTQGFENSILILKESRARIKRDILELSENKNLKQEKYTEQINEQKQKLTTLLSLPPMDPERFIRSDNLFKELNKVILQEQSEILNTPSSNHLLPELVWPKSLSQEQNKEREDLMTQWLNDVSIYKKEKQSLKKIRLDFLKEIKTIRRTMESDFGRTNIEEDLFWVEFNNDILLISLIAEQSIYSAQEIFMNVINLHVPELISLFRIVLNVIILLSVWWLLLRQSDFIARLVSSRKNWSYSSIEKIVKNLIFASLPFVVMILLIEEYPIISWLFRIYAFVFLFKCLRPILNALFVQDSDKQFKKLLFSLQLILFWWSMISVFDHLFIDIFQSDRLSDLLFVFGLICFAFVLLLVLHHWEEIISLHSKKEETNGFVRAVIQSTQSGFGHKILRSIVGVFVLLLSLLDYGFFVLVKGEGWVGSMLAERTIQELNTTLKPISDQKKQNFILQPKAHWDNFFEAVQDENFIIFVGTLDEKKWESFNSLKKNKVFLKAPYLHKKEDLERWICSQFDTHSIEEWVDQLSRLEESSFHIAEIERTLLRKVGGYDALEALLQLPDLVKKHQFIYSVGPYCWGFLQSQMKPIFMGKMPCVIQDNGFTAVEMTGFILKECERLEWNLRFFQLSKKSSSKETVKRVQEAYWRILWESSGGDLDVAKELFLSSVYHCEEEKNVEVLLFNKPKIEILSALSDKDKFLLTALLIHSALSVDQISDLLYMSKQEVLKVCSDLQLKNLLQYKKNEYFIPLRYRRTIAVYLKEQRLLC